MSRSTKMWWRDPNNPFLALAKETVATLALIFALVPWILIAAFLY